MRPGAGILAAMGVLGLGVVGAWLFAPSVLAEAQRLFERETIAALVQRVGFWGPVVIVGLMVLAVVASPLPSAPIALAAGAAYGHSRGTVQVVLGAEIGALIAFGLARFLGRGTLKRLFGEGIDRGLPGSQNALSVTMFASRLMPFVSFDMMIYAAGLSCLHAWRFALATLAGIIPASFFLAHVGGEAASGDLTRETWAVLGLGLVTGLPLLWIALRRTTDQEP